MPGGKNTSNRKIIFWTEGVTFKKCIDITQVSEYALNKGSPGNTRL